MILKPVEETEQDRNRFAQIIMSTTLGKTYYPNEAFLRHEIVNAPIEDERFLLADEETNENIGVLWINRRGAFHSFPFLHVIAIRSEYQGRGYGREAMKLFEDFCELQHEVVDLCEGKTIAGSEELLERRAFDIFLHDIGAGRFEI